MCIRDRKWRDTLEATVLPLDCLKEDFWLTFLAFASLVLWLGLKISASARSRSKARFPLAKLTARVDGWLVSITLQHGPCWRARVSTSRVDGPSTRPINLASGNCAPVNMARVVGYWKPSTVNSGRQLNKRAVNSGSGNRAYWSFICRQLQYLVSIFSVTEDFLLDHIVLDSMISYCANLRWQL